MTARGLRPIRATIPGLALVLLAAALMATGASAQTRVRDLTQRAGEVPRRLVGYGLVVGLDGSGDRSFGWYSNSTPTVRSVVNLLRRFHIEVPPEYLRLRNVAAVLVTAEVSPWLGAGGRFEVQVAALGDATSLRGGVLWMTPLVADAGGDPVATAQGPLQISDADPVRLGLASARRGNSGRIPDGGVLEVEPAARPLSDSLLVLREPDLVTAGRIAAAIDAALGAGTATVQDPGRIRLIPPPAGGPRGAGFLASVDTVSVELEAAARVVIHARDGLVVAGGAIPVAPSVVTLRGLTLRVGGATAGETPSGVVQLNAGASVQDVAVGLHAAGARPFEIAEVFEALRASGALRAEVMVR